MADAAFELIMSQLKANPHVSFAEVRDAAKKKGHTVYPISYGRAKLLLGLVKSKKGGKRKAAAAGAVKRGPGRPRKDEAAPVVKRGPGRPRKDQSVVPVKRGPGRPRKDGGMPIAKRGPGRPRNAERLGGLNGSVLDHVQSVVQERDRLRSILAQLRETLDSLV